MSDIEIEAQVQLLGLQREREDFRESRNANSLANAIKARNLHEANKKSLKSDMKKGTTFVKKIRSINSEGIQQCIRDTELLNLRLYISEIVGGILETQFKATDIPLIVKLCVALHLRYEEFTDPLIQGLRSSLLNVSNSNEDDKEAGKKRRIQIRFLLELFQAGIFTDDAFFAQVLYMLLGKRKAMISASAALTAIGEDKTGQSGMAINKKFADLQGLSTFTKYAQENVLGYAPAKLVDLSRVAGCAIEADSLSPADLELLINPNTSAQPYKISSISNIIASDSNSNKDGDGNKGQGVAAEPSAEAGAVELVANPSSGRLNAKAAIRVLCTPKTMDTCRVLVIAAYDQVRISISPSPSLSLRFFDV